MKQSVRKESIAELEKGIKSGIERRAVDQKKKKKTTRRRSGGELFLGGQIDDGR